MHRLSPELEDSDSSPPYTRPRPRLPIKQAGSPERFSEEDDATILDDEQQKTLDNNMHDMQESVASTKKKQEDSRTERRTMSDEKRRLRRKIANALDLERRRKDLQKEVREEAKVAEDLQAHVKEDKREIDGLRNELENIVRRISADITRPSVELGTPRPGPSNARWLESITASSIQSSRWAE